jgi:hypothetical protein
MIIRWVPANIRLIAYYANLMLISSFLGIGFGALVKGRGLNLFRFFPWILLIDILFLVICRKVTLPGFSLEFRFLSVSPTITNLTAVICIFLLNTVLFVPLGEKIGQLFDALPPLRAYSWDLGGSLLGTIGFGFFSLMFFSPSLGIGLVIVIYLLLVPRRSIWSSLVPLLVCLGCVYLASPEGALWSPYYYVTVDEVGKGREILIKDVPKDILTMPDPPRYLVKVNRDFLQYHRTINPDRYTKGTENHDLTQRAYLHHSLPYRLRPAPENVLIVGAGGGNDVEGALLNGAQHILQKGLMPVASILIHMFVR